MSLLLYNWRILSTLDSNFCLSEDRQDFEAALKNAGNYFEFQVKL